MDGLERKISKECGSTDELKIVKEINVLTGARKTMVSSINYHRSSKMLNSKVVNRSDLSKGITEPSINMSNTLKGGPLESTSTDTSTLKNELRVHETNTVNSVKLIKNEEPLKMTTERVLNSPLSFQSQKKFLGYGKKIYNKRPLESKKSPDIDLGIESHKNFRMSGNCEYKSRNDENGDGHLEGGIGLEIASSPGIFNQTTRVSPGYAFRTKTVLTHKSLLPVQNIRNNAVEQNFKPSFKPNSSFKIGCIEKYLIRTEKSKSVRLPDKEIPKLQVTGIATNAPILTSKCTEVSSKNKVELNPNFQTSSKGIAKKSVVRNKYKINPTMIKKEKFATFASDIVNFPQLPYMAESCVRNTNKIPRVYCPLLPVSRPSYRNASVVPNRGFQIKHKNRVEVTTERNNINETENQKTFIKIPFVQQPMEAHVIGTIPENYPHAARFLVPHSESTSSDINFPTFEHTTKTPQNSTREMFQNHTNSENFPSTNKVSKMLKNTELQIISDYAVFPYTSEAFPNPNTQTRQSNFNSEDFTYCAVVSKKSNISTNKEGIRKNSNNGKLNETMSLKGSEKSKENISNQSEQTSLPIKAVAVNGNNGMEPRKKSQRTMEKSRNKYNVQNAEKKLVLASALLKDINKTFINGFQCEGLENSLPIWNMELEQCILSVEKIRKVLSEYQAKGSSLK